MKGNGMRRCTAAGLLVAGMGAQATAGATGSGNLALASDYVWRGSSQTGGDPAVQAGVRLSARNGLYASAWGSNVAFTPDIGARSEFDAVLGWSGDLTPAWGLDGSVVRYVYPRHRARAGLD